MSPLVAFALFVQACLIQSVMSQQSGCAQNISPLAINGLNLGYNGIGNLNNAGLLPGSAINLGNAALSSVSSASCATYGGVGTGQVGVAGDVGASGNTVVVGSVPVLGAVDFSGVLPAAGSVSISGQCGCGCNA